MRTEMATAKAVITSSKGGLPIRSVNEEYKCLTGESIKYEKFGYMDLKSFLQSIPGVYIKGDIVTATSEQTKHIEKLISKQKPAKNGKISKYKPKVNNYYKRRPTNYYHQAYNDQENSHSRYSIGSNNNKYSYSRSEHHKQCSNTNAIPTHISVQQDSAYSQSAYEDEYMRLFSRYNELYFKWKYELKCVVLFTTTEVCIHCRIGKCYNTQCTYHELVDVRYRLQYLYNNSFWIQ